jgi:hypothetical protein
MGRLYGWLRCQDEELGNPAWPSPIGKALNSKAIQGQRPYPEEER